MIIGSTAMKEHFPDFNREPKDLDLACDERGMVNTKEVEYLYNPILFKYCEDDMIHPEILLTLKASHLSWDINWEKHMYDAQFIIGKGYTINRQLFYELYEFWNEYHGKNRRSDLKMSKEDFFDNAVNTKIDHDFIHTLINPEPIYKKTLKDGAEVETCEQKFYELTFDEKIKLVQEEVMVMASERYKGTNYRVRYGKMLKKFIIGHAPLYMAIFIVENYVRLLRAPFDFMSKINQELEREGYEILI